MYHVGITAGLHELLRKLQLLRAQYCDIILSKITINLGVLKILFKLN